MYGENKRQSDFLLKIYKESVHCHLLLVSLPGRPCLLIVFFSHLLFEYASIKCSWLAQEQQMKGAYDFNAAQVCHNLLFHWGLFFSVLEKQIDIMKNKPASQAAGADPF